MVTTLVGRPRGVECVPAFMTPRSPDRATLGPRLAEIAALMGKPLLPWQRAAVDVAYELDPATGYLCYSECDVIVMRQNGKSELLFPVMTHRSLGFDRSLTRWLNAEYGFDLLPPGPQRTLYLAQTADQARAKWRDVHMKRLQASPLSSLLLDVRLRQNQEQAWFTNGSTWFPGAATSKAAGTGDTLDLGVIDEGWAHKAGTELSIRPTMLTRPWRQLWMASMVPGPRRKNPGEWPYLLDKMKSGRARVQAGIRSGVFYLEFAAPEGADPEDPRTWWSCMPALGHTIQERAVREDFDELGLADFEAEYLSREPKMGSPQWLVVSKTAWGDRADPVSAADDPIALCVDSRDSGESTTISMCGLRGGDRTRVHVEVVDPRPGMEWAVARVVELVESWGVCCVVVDPAGAAAALIDPIEQQLTESGCGVPVLRPTRREVMAANARLVMACGVNDVATREASDDGTDKPAVPLRRLSHLGQPDLDRSIASAEKRWVGAQWVFTEALPGADLSPVRGIALAMWGGDKVDWEGAAYDIASSLG